MSKIPEGLEAGDRVRVVIEDEVESTSLDMVQLARRGTWLVTSDATVISLEKLEPDATLPDGLTLSEDGNLLNWLGENYVRQQVDETVEVFKPGDRLRYTAGLAPDFEVTLADEGYLQHLSSGRVFYRSYESETDRTTFTSKRYEKIEFIQPPF